MTGQISTSHLKQNVNFAFVYSVFRFHFSAPMEFPTRTTFFETRYLCMWTIYVNVSFNLKITQDKQLHAEKTVKIQFRVPELVDGFAD